MKTGEDAAKEKSEGEAREWKRKTGEGFGEAGLNEKEGKERSLGVSVGNRKSWGPRGSRAWPNGRRSFGYKKGRPENLRRETEEQNYEKQREEMVTDEEVLGWGK